MTLDPSPMRTDYRMPKVSSNVVVATTTTDTVVNVRLGGEVLEQLDELAREMDRSRSYLIEQAVREFVEREYASLSAVEEGECEIEAGKGIPHEQVSSYIDDLVRGKGRPKAFR
jgi:predicted transcriptional regulator